MTMHRRRFRISPVTAAAYALLGIIIAAGIFAPWLAPYNPTAQLDVVLLKNVAPSVAFPFGTDPFSRDILSRAMYGARTSLTIGVAGTSLAVIIASVWGVIAGSVPSRLGDMFMRIVDALRSIPRKVVLLVVMLVVPNATATVLALLLGMTSWMPLSQIIFSQVQALNVRDFVTAAKSLGASPARLLIRHIAPQLTGTISAASALMVADMIGVEAGLSFLGLGIRPPTASWGTMLQDGVPHFTSAWWVVATPCVLLVCTVMCIARIADTSHDAHFTRN